MNSISEVPVSTWTFAHRQSPNTLTVILNSTHLLTFGADDLQRVLHSLEDPTAPVAVDAYPVIDDETDEGMFFTPLIIGEQEEVTLDFGTDANREAFTRSITSTPWLTVPAVQDSAEGALALTA